MFVLEKSANNFRSLSQIFTPSNFNKIVKKKDKEYMRYCVKKHINSSKPESYNSIIKYLYNELHFEYRSEYFYKNALLNKLLLGKYSLNTTTVLNEFRIGGSIADFILLNGEARIFEIKTDLDSLTKLDKQVSDYKEFANKVYIVSCSKHANKLLNKYRDTEIGIIEFTKNMSLKTLKEAESNTDNFNHVTIFKTLRKQEYLNLIKNHFGEIPNVPGTKIFRECLSMAKLININDFQVLAFNQLKDRKIRCPNLLKSEFTPYELKHICYSMDYSENEYAELFNFLKEMI
ncbi:sce7726 family protein [Adhaeribacter arboris]|nr:sce7726 family protein [Adhaeribacter arboris]